MISGCCAVDGMSADDYHADPCASPSLSQSTAHLMHQRSPWHGWLYHPRLGKQRKESTPDQIFGQAVHARLLGQLGPEVALKRNGKPYAGMESAGAVKLRQEATAAGRSLISAAMDAKAAKLTEKIKDNLERLGIALNGASELSFFWEETTEAGHIQCRGRADHFVAETGTIYDIKTTYNASPRRIDRPVADYGYYLQAAAYLRGLGQAFPALEGRLQFVILFCESDTGAVCPAELSGELLRIGETDWHAACEWWGRGIHQNDWKRYAQPGERMVIDAPMWFLKQKGFL